jgi:type II secretory pathway pseudopilin PulG
MHTVIPLPIRRRRDDGPPTLPCPRRRSLSGFTILEVMFAATIMALVISTSVTVLQRAFIAMDSARKVTLAGQIMQSEFEKMRMQNWATVCAYPASGDITASIDVNFAASSAIARTFTITRTITDVHAEMKCITLATSWKSYDGRTSSRSYSTHYGKEGLYDYFYNSY